MNWKDWLTSDSHSIYIGNLMSMQLVFDGCSNAELDGFIAQLVPKKYKQGYLRYLKDSGLIMIDYGSANTFIFVQY